MPKRPLSLFLLVCLSFLSSYLQGAETPFLKTNDRILVYPDATLSGAELVQLYVIADDSVYKYNINTEQFYLLSNTGWYHQYAGNYFNSGNTKTANAPYESIAVFVKKDSIISFGFELQYTSEKPVDTLSLYVYAGKNARFTLYEDEGTSYKYEKGLFSNILVTCNEATKTLTIENRKESFPGMLQQKIFRVFWVKPGHPRALGFDQAADQEIRYSGKAVTIKWSNLFNY